MKIVHVVYSMEMGGAESMVAQLCRLQRAGGHDVAVVCYSNLGTLGEALRSDGFRVDVLGTAPVLQTVRRYIELFRAMRPDAVHCHNPAPTLQAALGARLAGARSIVSTRHSLVAPPYDTAAELKYAAVSRLCDHIVGICEATCANLRGAPLARRSRIVRVYNGAAAIQPLPAEELPAKVGTTFLFVGRLATIKDLPTLLRALAFALPQSPDAHLWLVGDGPARGALEALAAELGIASRVTFWGERHDVARFFRSADVFVMSSVSEGLPMSLLQAMSVGVPALVTDVGGMAEVVRLADGGVCVPVGDFEAMAAAMLRMAVDAGARAAYGQNARRAYEEQFALERMNGAYMRLYRNEE